MKNTVFKLAGVVVIFSSIALGWIAMEYNTFKKTPLNIVGDGFKYEIKKGMTLTSVANKLSQQGILEKPRYLRWIAKWQGVANAIKIGEYEFPYGTTPVEFLDKIVSGQVIHYSMTIVEGWNFKQLLYAVKNISIFV